MLLASLSSCKDREIIDPLPPLEVDNELVEYFASYDSGSYWKYLNPDDGRQNELRITKKYSIRRNKYDQEFERKGYQLNYEGENSENFSLAIQAVDPGKSSIRIDYRIGGGPRIYKEKGDYSPESSIRQVADTIINDITYKEILVISQDGGPHYTEFVFAKNLGIIAYTDLPKNALIPAGTYVLEEYSLK